MSRRAASPAQYNRLLAVMDERAHRDDIAAQHDRLVSQDNALDTSESVAALVAAGTITQDQGDRILIERRDRSRR